MFLHHNKAAGWLFKRAFEKRIAGSASVDRKAVRATFTCHARTHAARDPASLAPLRLVVGDYAGGLCGELPRQPCASLTVVRHPLGRLISAFVYCRRTHDQTCGARALDPKKATLLEFGRHQAPYLQLQVYCCIQ